MRAWGSHKIGPWALGYHGMELPTSQMPLVSYVRDKYISILFKPLLILSLFKKTHQYPSNITCVHQIVQWWFFKMAAISNIINVMSKAPSTPALVVSDQQWINHLFNTPPCKWRLNPCPWWSTRHVQLGRNYLWSFRMGVSSISLKLTTALPNRPTGRELQTPTQIYILPLALPQKWIKAHGNHFVFPSYLSWRRGCGIRGEKTVEK